MAITKIFFIMIAMAFSSLAGAQEPESSSAGQPSAKVPMTLKWNALDGVTSYNVTISRFATFKESRSFKTNRNYLPVMVFPNSHYFWKISALDDDERPINQRQVYEFDAVKGTSTTAAIDLFSEPTKVADKISQDNFDPTKPTTLTNNGEEVAESTPRRDLPEYQKKGFEIKIGTEAGMLGFKQTHSVFGDVEVDGFLFPALALQLQTPQLWDRFYGVIFFQQTIGDFETDDSVITLEDTDFQWLRYGAKGYVSVYKNDTYNFSAYVGVDYQKTPYFLTVTPSTMTIKEIDYFSGVIGARAQMQTQGAWTFHVDVAYILPFSESGEDVSEIYTDSATFLDGEIGAVYKTSGGLFFGGALKGSRRDIKEILGNATTTSTGSRTSTYIGVEVNAGLSF